MGSKKHQDTDSKAGKITRHIALGADQAAQVRGGDMVGKATIGYQSQKADGSLDAGVRFKLDIKG